jgi:O-antigen/teichoic acid export membrane protein
LDIRKSLIFSYLDRYASLVINIASSMVIARLLTPADIGVFSVTMVLLTFVGTVRDMGAGGYLVQEKEITLDRVRAVWAVQLGLGLFLAIAVLAASVPASMFYKEPRMREIMMIVALNYAINPFGSLTYAWQIREMRFDALAIVRFSATVTGAVVSIFLAYRGMGPISLAYGSLASTIVNALMAIHYRPAWFPWLPGIKEIKRVLAYGSQTTGAAMIDTIFINAPELLLGKLQNMTATGLFSRASGLVTMFDRMVLSGIASVAVSWFSKQSREHNTIAQPFLKATSYITALGWPFAVAMVFLAHPIMRILYGDQWDGAVDITRVLAVAFAIGLPSQMCISALMALGCASMVLRGAAVTTAVALPVLAAGAYFGTVELAGALIVTSLVKTTYWLTVAQRAVAFEWKKFMRLLSQSALVGVGAGIAPLLAFLQFGARPANIWPEVLLGGVGTFVGFVVTVFLTRHPLTEELLRIKDKLLARRIK